MLTAIIIAAAVAALIVFFFLCYKKAPPTQAIVVTGLGLSRPKVVCGRGVFVLPIVQRADRLNMRLLKIDVKTPDLRHRHPDSNWLAGLLILGGVGLAGFLIWCLTGGFAGSRVEETDPTDV